MWSSFWYLLRTRQFYFFKAKKGGRYIGPCHSYYDGHHFGFGFWWFNLAITAYKDYDNFHSKLNMIDLMERLLHNREE